MWKVAIVTRSLSGGGEENHEKPFRIACLQATKA
jgi:hypothetical protein